VELSFQEHLMAFRDKNSFCVVSSVVNKAVTNFGLNTGSYSFPPKHQIDFSLIKLKESILITNLKT
jgi:hypothetical protein